MPQMPSRSHCTSNYATRTANRLKIDNIQSKICQPHNYVLNNTVINRVSCVRELGVMLHERLSFDSHLASVIGKAYSNLGLIFCMTSDFTDLRCLKALYCSLVCPVIEYASAVFCTNRVGWNNKVQYHHYWY